MSKGILLLLRGSESYPRLVQSHTGWFCYTDSKNKLLNLDLNKWSVKKHRILSEFDKTESLIWLNKLWLTALESVSSEEDVILYLTQQRDYYSVKVNSEKQNKHVHSGRTKSTFLTKAFPM